MTVKEIVEAYLAAHGLDGLWSPDGDCFCKCGDLMPCDDDSARCQPGYLIRCPCGQHDWHIATRDKVQ